MSVKFYAACALERLCRDECVRGFVISVDLEKVVNLYLSLIDEIESDKLTITFGNIIELLDENVKAMAVEICEHLKM